MPIYEYSCNNCGNSFDALRSVQAADAPIECSHCHKEDSKRLLSTFFSHGQSKSAPLPSDGSSCGCGGCSGGSCSTCRH